MVKKVIIWVVLVFTVIMLFINTAVYLNYAMKLKFEVQHPLMMGKGEANRIETREKEILGIINFLKIIYAYELLILCSGIFLLIKSNLPRDK